MKFGIHNPSWVYGSDPADAFQAIKAKAQWAENHGFVWFSVMDHLIVQPFFFCASTHSIEPGAGTV